MSNLHITDENTGQLINIPVDELQSVYVGASVQQSFNPDTTKYLRMLPAPQYVNRADYPEISDRLPATDDISKWGLSLIGTTVTPASPNWRLGAYGNGAYVLVTLGLTPGMTRSTDLLDGFYAVSFPESVSFRSVAYGNNTFVAILNTSTNNWTSPDGLTWTKQTGFTSGTYTGIAHNGTTFLVLANSVSVTNAYGISTNGVTWTFGNLPAAMIQCTDLQAYGNTFYACGSSGATAWMATSTDGVNWTVKSVPLFGAAGANTIAYKASTNTIVIGMNSGILVASTDGGTTWSAGRPALAAAFPATSIVTCDGTYFYMPVTSQAGYFRSLNGINWSFMPLPEYGTWNTVFTLNGVVFMLGSSQQVFLHNSVAADKIYMPTRIPTTNQHYYMKMTT